jgi:hypothetical protein
MHCNFLIQHCQLITKLSLTVIAVGIFDSGQGLAQISPSQQPIPTTNWEGAVVPDFSQITFESLPSFTTDGSLSFPSELLPELGYNPERSWSANQPVDQVMMLGDFQDSFALQNLTLQEIDLITGLDLKNFSLDQFGLVAEQTVETLVAAIPSMANIPVQQILPLSDLLAPFGINQNQTVGQVIAVQQIANLSLANLSLENYQLKHLPGLSNTPLGNFDSWQEATIEEIPGLNLVPFNQFPNPPIIEGQTVALVDVPYSNFEGYANRSLSGSYQEGFTVACQGQCSHLELSSQIFGLNGQQWVNGQSQKVRGGQGILGQAFQGQEPTGRHPFGNSFKQVIWTVDEGQGTVETAMFFRFCRRNAWVNLGCTPYGIGPIPFLNYREKEMIFLGQ